MTANTVLAKGNSTWYCLSGSLFPSVKLKLCGSSLNLTSAVLSASSFASVCTVDCLTSDDFADTHSAVCPSRGHLPLFSL